MSNREWNVQNRARIDARILAQCPNVRRPITDADRALWVDSDSQLYFARRAEVAAGGQRGTYWSKAVTTAVLGVLLVTLAGCGGGGGGAAGPTGPSADDSRRCAVITALAEFGPTGAQGPDAEGVNVFRVDLACGAVVTATWADGTDLVTLAAVDVNYRDADTVVVPISGLTDALAAFPNWYQYPGAQ